MTLIENSSSINMIKYHLLLKVILFHFYWEHSLGLLFLPKEDFWLALWVWINDITENHEFISIPPFFLASSFTTFILLHVLFLCSSYKPLCWRASLISFVLLVLALTVKGMFCYIWSINSQKIRCAFYFLINIRSCNKITVYLKLTRKFELKTLAVKVLFPSPFLKWHLSTDHLLFLQILYILLLLPSCFCLIVLFSIF